MNRSTLLLFIVLQAFPCAIAVAAEDSNVKGKAARGSDTIAASRSVQVSGVSGVRVREMVLKAAAERAGLVGLAPESLAGRIAVRPGTDDGLSGRRIGLEAAEVLMIVVDLRGADAAAAGVKPRAVEYLDAIVASLEKQLQDFHSGRVQRAEQSKAETEHRIKDMDQKAAHIEADIRDATGRVDASVDAIRAAVPKLEEERQSLKLQVIGKQARQDALAQTIERHAKQAEAQLKDDEITGQLEKIVGARATHLERVRKLFEAGQAPQAEVIDAETAIAEARTRILERREAVKQSAGGGELLGKLNQELAMLSIDVAEAEAKLSAIEKLLQKYGQAQPLLTDAERVRRDRERAEKSRDIAEAELRDAQATVPDPVLRVMESDATPATSPAAP
jgi:hypothetical protein